MRCKDFPQIPVKKVQLQYLNNQLGLVLVWFANDTNHQFDADGVSKTHDYVMENIPPTVQLTVRIVGTVGGKFVVEHIGELNNKPFWEEGRKFTFTGTFETK